MGVEPLLHFLLFTSNTTTTIQLPSQKRDFCQISGVHFLLGFQAQIQIDSRCFFEEEKRSIQTIQNEIKKRKIKGGKKRRAKLKVAKRKKEVRPAMGNLGDALRLMRLEHWVRYQSRSKVSISFYFQRSSMKMN